MGHNSVISSQLKSTGISRVVNGTLGFWVSQKIHSGLCGVFDSPHTGDGVVCI